MKRFTKSPPDKFGNIIISDILNSEPVCTIYGKYHSYAIDIIFKALEKYQNSVKTKRCKCKKTNIPKDWLHCGCGIY